MWLIRAYALHIDGAAWGKGIMVGLVVAWLYDSIRELRWCVEQLYYAIEKSENDDNQGFPWGRSAVPRKKQPSEPS
jgi:hypothetical protein